MQKILIVIDMQNDFVTGPLGSEAAQVAAKNIAAHINEYDTVIPTAQIIWIHWKDRFCRFRIVSKILKDGRLSLNSLTEFPR